MALNKNIVIGIYFHPEAYPPTLNAIGELAKEFSSVYVVFRPHREENWVYPSNCHLIPSGKLLDIDQQQSSSLLKKVLFFIRFNFLLFQTVKKYKSPYLLLYDYFPMSAAYLMRLILPKNTRFWYHNHDVAEIEKSRKFSLGWWSIKMESRMFKYLSIFSYPSKERLKFFNLKEFKGKQFFLPNYPSIKFYKDYQSNYIEGKKIKLLYQGTISKGHGLESVVKATKDNQNMELFLAGSDRDGTVDYLKTIKSRNIFYKGLLPYNELPSLTSHCHIGLAINEPRSIIYQTGGTASNKIYEYAACGLPIIYFDNKHYNKYLGKYEWAYASDLTKESILHCINAIVANYEYLSKQAKKDFEYCFNYNLAFQPIVKHILIYD